MCVGAFFLADRAVRQVQFSGNARSEQRSFERLEPAVS